MFPYTTINCCKAAMGCTLDLLPEFPGPCLYLPFSLSLTLSLSKEDLAMFLGRNSLSLSRCVCTVCARVRQLSRRVQMVHKFISLEKELETETCCKESYFKERLINPFHQRVFILFSYLHLQWGSSEL